MNKRPKPTRLLIQELTGDDRTLVESLHHGLDECTSLSTIYINLDLDELVAFAASTRKGREKGDYDPSMNLHEAFGHAFRIGLPWLRKNRRITEATRSLYERLNPYQGKDLADRLTRIDSADAATLMAELARPTANYIFECQQGEAYRRTPGREVRVMNFQNYYPKSGRIVPAFINEISKVIGTYPREYNLPQVSTQSGKPEHIARTVKKQLDKLRGGRPMQLDLFRR